MKQAEKTHCPKGHAYSGPNLYVNPKGARVCRICRRANNAASELRCIIRRAQERANGQSV